MNQKIPVISMVYHLAQCVKECDNMEVEYGIEKELNEDLLKCLQFIKDRIEKGQDEVVFYIVRECINHIKETLIKKL
jgi:hypothetical protein